MEFKTLAFRRLAAFILAFAQTEAESIFSELRTRGPIVELATFSCNFTSITLSLAMTSTPFTKVNTYPLSPKTSPICKGKDSNSECCVHGLAPANNTAINVQAIVSGILSICVSPCNSDNSSCNVDVSACSYLVPVQTHRGKCVPGGCQLARTNLQVLDEDSVQVSLSLNENDCKKDA